MLLFYPFPPSKLLEVINSKVKDEIVETLKELIKIPSVRSEVEENAPFGKDCARLLRLIEQLYKDNGFETELDSNGGYLLSYYGRETTPAEKLHLLACAAVIYYYWFVWGVYASKNGEEVSEWIMGWFDKMCFFRKEVLNQLEKGSNDQ